VYLNKYPLLTSRIIKNLNRHYLFSFTYIKKYLLPYNLPDFLYLFKVVSGFPNFLAVLPTFGKGELKITILLTCNTVTIF
jgi:hypothetical protein